MLGNFGDVMKLMSHLNDIQNAVKSFKEELPKLEYSATAAGGRVKVVLSGDFTVRKIEIADGADPSALAAELTEAFNAAAASAKTALLERIKSMAGSAGIDVPAQF